MFTPQRTQNSKTKQRTIVRVRCTFTLGFFFSSFFCSTVSPRCFAKMTGFDSFRKNSAKMRAAPEIPPATNLVFTVGVDWVQRQMIVHLTENAAKRRTEDVGG